MEAKCDNSRYSTKRELSSVGGEVSTTYNLRKKVRLKEKDDSSLVSESAIFDVSRGVQSTMTSVLEKHRFYNLFS